MAINSVIHIEKKNMKNVIEGFKKLLSDEGILFIILGLLFIIYPLYSAAAVSFIAGICLIAFGFAAIILMNMFGPEVFRL